MRAERADTLDGELRDARRQHEAAMEELRRSNGALSAELATLKEKTANFDEQKRLLIEAREELLKEFQNTGSAVLTKAQEAFLERANERLGHSEKTSEAKIRELLQPVGDRLKKYEDQVAALEEKRGDAFSRLYQQIADMQRGQEEVRREAQRLGNSLTNAPKARGRWGERLAQDLTHLVADVRVARLRRDGRRDLGISPGELQDAYRDLRILFLDAIKDRQK